MNFKPSDFFIGIFDLFAILLPGLVFIHLWIKEISFIFHFNNVETSEIALFLVISYIVGHFLLNISYPLDLLYFQFHKKSLGRNKFYKAFSFIRMNNVSALQELERNTAHYKLFRSLSLVFFIEIIHGFIGGTLSPWIFIVLTLLSCWRYWFLKEWTEELALDFEKTIRENIINNN
ncbi:hypothetical protein [uncultured Aquimarina sp.]|uniref:hypothetical protein n=1 Tax=uncultured Aquimarina sp. TaxID=575652 RepID=UPI002626EC95|nr:hypothetical protein [uncultured Aquimarina sp.]